MIVSNFELLVKRIAPPGDPVSRRVVQGYFLSVTNLENRKINLALGLTISNASENRIINPNINVQGVFDNGGTDNQTLNIFALPPLPGNPFIRRYKTGQFTLRAGQTGLVAILPNVGLFANTPNPNLEIRGYVELNQRRISNIVPSDPVPVATVLVTPETRGTFLDDDYPNNDEPSPFNGLDFDQISYSLPTASGAAQNEVKGLKGILERMDTIKRNIDNPDALKEAMQKENPECSVEEINDYVEMIMAMKDNDQLFKLMDSIRKPQKTVTIKHQLS